VALYEAALKVRKGRGCWGNYKNSSVATSVDVRSRRLRPTSPRRLLEFTVLRRHDVGARRRWDQCMTSSRRPHDVEFLAGGPQFCSNPPVLWTPVVFTKISDFFAFQNLKKSGQIYGFHWTSKNQKCFSFPDPLTRALPLDLPGGFAPDSRPL